MYIWNLPIGDWSGDGHSICEHIKIGSNIPLQDCRELYFKTKEKLGISPEDICDEYQDSKVYKKDLDKMGLSFEEILVDYEEGEDGVVFDLGDFVELFILFMVKNNSPLTLQRIKEKEDMFPFYGFDDKKRHIGFLGYGLFD